MWSHWSRGVMVTVLAGACCLGAAVAVRAATRSDSPKRARTRHRPIGSTETATAVEHARARSRGPHRCPRAARTESRPTRRWWSTSPERRIANVRVTSTTGTPVAGHPRVLRHAVAVDRSRSRTARPTASPRPRPERPSARVQLTSTFRTLAPATTRDRDGVPADGLSVGVGQPIVFRFDHYISSAAARGGGAEPPRRHRVATGARWLALVQQQRAALPAGERTGPRTSKVTVSWDLARLERGRRHVGRRRGRRALLGRRRARVVRESRDAQDDGHRQRAGRRDVPDQRRQADRSHDERRAHRARPCRASCA